jgi:nucleoside-diphosphate-sugar epimerase
MASEGALPKKVLLFGATGVIGIYILQALIESKASFEKIGIFTSPGTAENKKDDIDSLKAKGVDVVVGDVHDEGDVKKAYESKFRLHLSDEAAPHPNDSTYASTLSDCKKLQTTIPSSQL